MSDPRLDTARAAFKTVTIALRDDILDDALRAVLRVLDERKGHTIMPYPPGPERYNSLGQPILDAPQDAAAQDLGTDAASGAKEVVDDPQDG